MFKNNLTPPPKKSPSHNYVQTKCNNDYHDSRRRNNERNQLES